MYAAQMLIADAHGAHGSGSSTLTMANQHALCKSDRAAGSGDSGWDRKLQTLFDDRADSKKERIEHSIVSCCRPFRQIASGIYGHSNIACVTDACCSCLLCYEVGGTGSFTLPWLV